MAKINGTALTKWSLAALLLSQPYVVGGCEASSRTDTELHEAAALADTVQTEVAANSLDHTGKGFEPVTYYYIRAKHSNKCLHQHGGTTGNGDPITQWDCVDQGNVQWRIEPSPDKNYYYIKARHSDKCAHQHGGTTGNGDPITQWECVNQGNVKWRLIPAGKNYFHIQAQHSKKCMHVHGGGSANGAAITQWSCIDQANVLWRFDPVGH
jgi:hypothetical protein